MAPVTVTTLDLRGLLCPEPVLHAARAAATLPAGSRLVLECTDPGAAEDLPVWCRMHGHECLSIEEGDEAHLLRIELRIGQHD